MTARAACLVLALLAACGTTSRREPPPRALEPVVQVPGMPGVRAWGDALDEAFLGGLRLSVEQEEAAGGRAPGESVDLLALSGGGGEGAFGAGLLCGWTAAGDRPRFKVVTGISTGAMIAPFAFLGPEYDERLKASYTDISAGDIYRRRSIFGMLGGSSIAESGPLLRLVERQFDDALIARVAEEHRRGRRLYVGTTALDAGRSVIWDMGAIAASGDPQAPRLFRRILLASSAIPVAFPPVFLEVEAEGRRYDEMHVDGSASTQVFLHGPVLRILASSGSGVGARVRVFVVINGKLSTEWSSVSPRLYPIAQRSVATLVLSQARGDLLRIHAETQRAGALFRLAAIPDDSAVQGADDFDREAMRALFAMGFDLGRAGNPWRLAPPGAP